MPRTRRPANTPCQLRRALGGPAGRGGNGCVHELGRIGAAHGARAAPAAILGMTPRPETARRLALVWGVHPVICDGVLDVEAMTDVARRAAVQRRFAQAGQTIVIAAGLPFGTPGSTNLLRIAQVE
ncbi:pyruvate kinase alpha/beta domain-containing protein [Ralstonia solanacearum]|uniref:pyruvate kinase alpha/beta domain-containing protein n=1 Tax=Ralstonia solanacearum TaxID=305 RepID=UPI003AF32DD0